MAQFLEVGSEASSISDIVVITPRFCLQSLVCDNKLHSVKVRLTLRIQRLQTMHFIFHIFLWTLDVNSKFVLVVP